MSDRESTGGSAFPPSSFGDAMTHGGPEGATSSGTADATFGDELYAGASGASGASYSDTSFSSSTFSTSPIDESMGQGQGMGGQGGGSEGTASTTDKAKEVAGQAQEKATQAVDTAKEKAGQVAGQASDKVDTGIDKAASGLSSLAGTLRERGEGMGDGGAGGAVGTVATTAAERLDAASQYLQNKDTDQLMTDLEELVRRKPAQSLMAAAGVGFLLSKVLR